MTSRSKAFTQISAILLGGALLSACGEEPANAVSVEGRQVASMRGIVPAAIDGEDLLVDIVYAVMPDEDVTEAGERALAEIEPDAVPLHRWRYAFTSITWDTLPVNIYYNGTNVDSSVSSADHTGTYQDSLQVWNDVSTSDFQFNYAGATTRCPSLVRECGAQVFDGYNDTTWIALSGSASTLAVTWTGTSTDEADQAYNTNNTWSIGNASTSNIDFLTVAMHENGHSLGLDHSSSTSATMYAYYSAADWSLSQDDIDGVSAKYPSGGGGGGGGGECLASGETCSSSSECCSNKCTGKPSSKTCK
jgi:hypothetical protein